MPIRLLRGAEGTTTLRAPKERLSFLRNTAILPNLFPLCLGHTVTYLFGTYRHLHPLWRSGLGFDAIGLRGYGFRRAFTAHRAGADSDPYTDAAGPTRASPSPGPTLAGR